MDFWYQVINPNDFFVDPIQSVSLTGFAAFKTSPDYLFFINPAPADEIYAPDTALRDATGDSLTFSGFPIGFGDVFAAGKATKFLLVRTDAYAFSSTSLATIQFAGIFGEAGMPPVPAVATLNTFGPAPVPEPSTLTLIPLALVALVAKLRRCGR